MPAGSAYERELLHVFNGTRRGVDAVTKSCTTEERLRMRTVIEAPFLAVRAPGSGSEGTGDLLVLRGDACFPIEVKSTATPKLYLSGRTLEQHEALRSTGERTGVMPLYAHRLKGVRGDSWRMFRVHTVHITGPMAAVASRVPTLPLTSSGRPHLDWDRGMPLNRFLHLISTTSVGREGRSMVPQGPAGSGMERGGAIDMLTSLLQARSP
jgi:Holliday junction resolvase